MEKRIRQLTVFAVCMGVLTFASVATMSLKTGGSPKPATYPNEYGYKTAIIWFEVVSSPDELFKVLGNAESDGGRELRRTMDLMNRMDFVFMACYSIFFASLFLLLRGLIGEERGRAGAVILWAGILLSALMLAGDILENSRLLMLTEYRNPSAVDQGTILLLQVFTRVKWFAIFAASILVAAQYRLYFGMTFAGFLLPLVFVASAAAGIASFIMPAARSLLELSANLLGLGWLIALVHAIVILVKRIRGGGKTAAA